MTAALWVALGGAIGSVARYKLGELVLLGQGSWKFPLGTLIVNLMGCFAIGILASVGERSEALSQDAKAFLFAGLLGGFTTFSAFGFETFNLLRRGEVLIACSYMGLSVLGGVLAVYIGFFVTGLLGR